MQKIIPFLWFDGQAEEAANFYVSLFDDGRVGEIMRWGEGGRAPKGSVLTVDFEIQGQKFTAMNGGPEFKFNEAISLQIECADQAEVDRLWDALTADGGQPVACGWLKDRYGLSWQVTPSVLPRLLKHSDPATADRVMQAMMQMTKIDIAKLEEAAAGASAAA